MKSSFFKPLLTICILGVSIWYFTNQYSTDILSKADITHDEKEKENPLARLEHEFKMLKSPLTGKVPRGIHQKAVQIGQKTAAFQLQKYPNQKNIPTINIKTKGPDNYGGRTRAMAFDSENPNIIIAGGVSSGIFRSTDKGENWTRVTPSGMIHNLTTIAQGRSVASNSNKIWYAGTGENLGNSASEVGANYYGHGIWKSEDNGLNWTALQSTQGGDLEFFDDDFDFISKIIVNPNNGHVLAMTGAVIKRSVDEGDNWQDELGDPDNNEGEPSDIIYNTVSNRFYAAIHGGAAQGGIWTSPDGDNWTQIRTPQQLDPDGVGVGRIILANAGNTAGIVAMSQLDMAFSCSNGGSSEVGLAHFDGTSTWTDHTDEISECASGSTDPKGISLQGAYNMCITTKPNNPNLVYLGGVEIFRYNLSNNQYDFIGGSQLAASAINLHVDNHILLFEDNDVLWAGNDGGLRNTNVSTSILDADGFIWNNKNKDYITYQYYDADIHPDNGSEFLAGAAQDNAFTIQPTTTNAEAREVGPTADGIAVGIISGTDFDTYTLIAGSQEGGICRLVDGDDTFIQPEGWTQGFNTKFHLDDDNRNVFYYFGVDNKGTEEDDSDDEYGLQRTRAVSTIADGTITGNSNTGYENLTGITNAISSAISAVATSRNVQHGGAYTASDTDRKLYFGTENGKIFRLSDPAFTAANTTPADITPSGASGYVSDIAVNPVNDQEVLVTYSNYDTRSVWHTSDASVTSPTWTDIEGANGTAVEISSARSSLIVRHNNSTIYLIGTSSGLYGTDALNGTNTSWMRIGTDSDIGLAVCSEMRLRTGDNHIALGTHGNGLFLLDFDNNALSVEYANFTGKAVKEGNFLMWSTATETFNQGFEIQRSTDGDTFEKVGYVAGNGFSSTQQGYEFLDQMTATSTIYYRLKQIDEDGTYEYSAVISINRGTDKEEIFKVYPNPVVDNLMIENGSGVATIYNISGQRLLEININSDQQLLDVSSLPQGNYVLTLQAIDGQLWTKQFVK